MRFIAYEKRQKLRRDALLAQDFYEMFEMLTLFVRDLGFDGGESIALDWQYSRFPRSGGTETRFRRWERDQFGRDALARPYEMLEFLTNAYALNPKPRAVILTEGMEWRGVKILFERVGFDPDYVGIEFRSLAGAGNFTLANWQCFVEYMHEKQVLVYFLVDKEGRNAAEARKLLKAKRRFLLGGLTKVIPEEERIVVWRTSFEEDNFGDAEIARALNLQGLAVSRSAVRNCRRRRRRRALIAELEARVGTRVDKGQLAEDLAKGARLASWEQVQRGHGMAIQKFLWSSGERILLNHQPVNPESRERNRATGLLG